MKKTTFKRIAASIAALCICSMAVAPVVASAGTITIKGTGETGAITTLGKTFAAYKIFDVKSSGTGAGASYNYTIVSAWETVVEDALGLDDSADSEDIANALEAIESDSAAAQTFAQYLANHIPAGVSPADETTTAATGDTVELSVDDAGYYMVVDTTGAVTGSAVSAVMLNTANTDATVTLKVDAPKIEKKIWEDGTVEGGTAGTVDAGELYEANTANMYETVNYYVTSAVPDHTHYTKYFFVMEDTIEEGLTFDETSVKATIGGESVTVTVDFQDKNDDGHNEYMVITFPDLKGYAVDAAVVVQYSAKVNPDAHVDAEGNVNGIKLNYSNKPTQSGNGLTDTDGDGTPDKWDDDDDNDDIPDGDDSDTPETPTDDDSTSDTPEEKVITYLTKFDINKVDGSGNKLDGAEFTIYTSESGTDAVKFNKETLDDGTEVYCVAADGTITAIPAGSAIIYGLDEDTHYWIEETAWPDGYNPIDGRIEFEVLEAVINDTTNILDAAYTYVDTDKSAATWTYKVTASDSDVNGGAATSNSNSITVANQAGGLFPTTGGIGTTIFTVVGVSLMAGAAGAFAIKRKAMNK